MSKQMHDATDLVGYMSFLKRGAIKLRYGIDDVEEQMPCEIIQLDHNWPQGLPDDKTTMYKIDANINPPESRRPKKSQQSIEFEETCAALVAGQSFEVECKTNIDKSRVNSMLGTAKKKNPNKTLISRRSENGIRIYCLEVAL